MRGRSPLTWNEERSSSKYSLRIPLDDLQADGVKGHQVEVDEQTVVLPRLTWAEAVRAHAVELGSEHHQHVQTGLVLDQGIGPDLAQP